MDVSVAKQLRRIRTLGRGASGAVVWLASDEASGKLLAVKSAAAGGGAAQLEREGSVLNGLCSPHIIPCLGSRAAECGEYQLFLEFAPGGSLADEAARSGGCLPEPAIRAYAGDVARALEYLHARSLVHGDVKARNVVIGGDGRARLTDFGCARAVDSPLPIGGTPAFMAPEVARGEEQGPASDVWALGCTVVEMATGRAPWSDMSDLFAAVHRIGYTGAVPEVPGWLSAEGKDFLAGCFRRQASDRSTAAQLLDHPFVASAVVTREYKAEEPVKQEWTSPNSTLQDALWDSDTDDEADEMSTTPAERIGALACAASALPDWDSDEGWIHVHGDGEVSRVHDSPPADAGHFVWPEEESEAVREPFAVAADGNNVTPRHAAVVIDGDTIWQDNHFCHTPASPLVYNRSLPLLAVAGVMTPPTPPPPPPPAGRGLAGAFSPSSSTSLLTPSALAQAADGGANAALVPTAAPPAAAQPAPVPAPSPLSSVYINQHVPIVLSLNPPNYSQWRTLFEVTFSKYGVAAHLDGPARRHDPAWVQDDAHLLSWLYNRVSPEIFGLIHRRGATAAEVWGSISTLFLDNAEHQAVYLSTEFRSAMQGSSSIISYFARLKELADRLADLGEPIGDRAQVLNMFRGLHPRFQYAIPILTMQTPFPSFLRARAFLLVEESRLNAAEGSSDTALHAGRAPSNPTNNNGGGRQGNSGGRHDNGGARTNSGGGRNGNGKWKGKAKVVDHSGEGSSSSGGGGSSSSNTQTRFGAPVVLPQPAANPWTGMVHAWPMPWRPHTPGSGILGPRLGAPPPFAGSTTHYGAPPAPAPGNPAWDQTALIQALNAMGIQQQQPQVPGADWYLDTGASSHMSSSPGPANPEGDPPL